MRKGLYLLCMISLCVYINAQESLLNQKDKVFNWGVKVGMNALQPDIDYIVVEDVTVNNIHTVNDVGYNIELLGRFNLNRFFLQPSVVWKYSQGDICFDLVRPPLVGTNDPVIEDQTLSIKMYTLETPFVIGFYVVKENPYVLSVMAGTKFKYNYQTEYTSENKGVYMDTPTSYYLSAYAAFEVVIGKLTFDFGYEYGINKMKSDFDFMNDISEPVRGKMKKRLDGISMSIGILF